MGWPYHLQEVNELFDSIHQALFFKPYFEKKQQFLPYPIHPFLYVSEIRTCDVYNIGFTTNQQVTAHRLQSYLNRNGSLFFCFLLVEMTKIIDNMILIQKISPRKWLDKRRFRMSTSTTPKSQSKQEN